MRRAILTLGGTVAGVVALLSFKTHSAADVSAAGPSAPSGSTSSSRPSPAPTTSSPPGSGGGTATVSTRTVTGTAASTQYGPMQVQLVLTGKTITRVNVLQQTDAGARSTQIDSAAIPKLTSETLIAQSARIDAVSGATYTSRGYVQSLQSALDAA